MGVFGSPVEEEAIKDFVGGLFILVYCEGLNDQGVEEASNGGDGFGEEFDLGIAIVAGGGGAVEVV